MVSRKASQGSTPVMDEQESEATVGKGSLELDS